METWDLGHIFVDDVRGEEGDVCVTGLKQVQASQLARG